ncbi:hypothetical protein JTE90_001324 [Oedothorax gibbosus]|uniref:Uncharacterized protein n=1 Tax=Oedothorax gibbosus TaxID=931172 RepID=A0AAV6U2U7_9ARAC|nr:hypothetical protein JTE90_001324 [Oedothorax gibbosus]
MANCIGIGVSRKKSSPVLRRTPPMFPVPSSYPAHSSSCRVTDRRQRSQYVTHWETETSRYLFRRARKTLFTARPCEYVEKTSGKAAAGEKIVRFLEGGICSKLEGEANFEEAVDRPEGQVAMSATHDSHAPPTLRHVFCSSCPQIGCLRNLNECSCAYDCDATQNLL